MEIRCIQNKKDYCILSFHKSNGKQTKKKKPQTETYSVEKEERSMEYHQTKTKDRNTKEKNLWRCRGKNDKMAIKILTHQ